MNKHLQTTQAKLYSLFEETKTAVRQLTPQQHKDLLHECEEMRFCETFSLRTSAELVRAAIIFTQEDPRSQQVSTLVKKS